MMLPTNETKDWAGDTPTTPKGQSVDCDVCIAKAGEPCYIQTSAEEHRRSGHVYTSGNMFVGKERFHVGVRLSAGAGAAPPTPSLLMKRGRNE